LRQPDHNRPWPAMQTSPRPSPRCHLHSAWTVSAVPQDIYDPADLVGAVRSLQPPLWATGTRTGTTKGRLGAIGSHRQRSRPAGPIHAPTGGPCAGRSAFGLRSRLDSGKCWGGAFSMYPPSLPGICRRPAVCCRSRQANASFTWPGPGLDISHRHRSRHHPPCVPTCPDLLNHCASPNTSWRCSVAHCSTDLAAATSIVLPIASPRSSWTRSNSSHPRNEQKLFE